MDGEKANGFEKNVQFFEIRNSPSQKVHSSFRGILAELYRQQIKNYPRKSNTEYH